MNKIDEAVFCLRILSISMCFFAVNFFCASVYVIYLLEQIFVQKGKHDE